MAALLKLDIFKAVMTMLAFVPGDIAKAVLASIIGMAVRRSYPIISTQKVAFGDR
jgi:biotin transporter BioY